jgi:hypothetical protein
VANDLIVVRAGGQVRMSQPDLTFGGAGVETRYPEEIDLAVFVGEPFADIG